MSYKPPGIRDVGLPAHVDSLAPTSNGLGWTILDLAFTVGLNDSAVGLLFNKHRRTISGWRKIYNERGFNNGK